MGTFEIQLDVVFGGDRDAAVDLDGLGGDVAERLRRGDVRQRRRRGAGVVDRFIDHGTGHLHLDVHVGHPVLESLETADRPAELHAFLAVFNGQFQASGGRADLLGGQQQGARCRPVRDRRRSARTSPRACGPVGVSGPS